MSVVSLGPGNPEYLAPRAREVLSHSEVLVGYRTYVELLDSELLQGKKVISTGMTKEIERCTQALEQAASGLHTSLVCSGDAGIYAMAGLVHELLEQREDSENIRIQVIPGIPALCAAAALLGSPLMQDFACISLSDLLTNWEEIENRINAASSTDFVLIFYNPKSRKRDWQLKQATQILKRHRGLDTPVGIVKNASKAGESVKVTDLAEFDPGEVDMLCILIVGNSRTKILNGKMVTSRGYLERNLVCEKYPEK